jgi:hypothetical protein
VTHASVPDPALGCGKTYAAEWRCDGDSTVHRATLPRGADWGHIVRLTCEGPAAASGRVAEPSIARHRAAGYFGPAPDSTSLMTPEAASAVYE